MAQQSLYRRYRPRRFGEMVGQEHVVRALRNAVASHREGQAYLFSGPRGTGKTTSARILAKVLNCENPVDGEPCCECESCKSVEAGTSFDVIELDAASNNKVDDIRELIDRVNITTPGRHKVYILDEVHMLTPGAEAALLKTLEEPPPHVVFVLATTDPQKVRDTIRSRTQHLSFHLLNAEELEAHVRWVAQDAGIELDEDAVQAVVRQGGGSARDTLSALEVVAAGGGVAPEMVPLDEFVEAVIEKDPGRALAAVAASVHLGRDVRSIAESVLAQLRECFLSLMAPELVQLPDQRAEVASEQARRLGAAGCVRAMEVLGEMLVDMRHAPDPRVLLEVALVRLTSPTVGTDLQSLSTRLERLEKAVAQGGNATGPVARPAPTDPATGRALLGGRARTGAPTDPTPTAGTPRPAPTPAKPAPVSKAPVVEPPPAQPPSEASAIADTPPATAPAASTADLGALFENVVKPGLRGMAKAIFITLRANGTRDGALVVMVPNDGHAKKAAEYQKDIEKALSTAAGMPTRIVIEIDGAAAPARPAPPPRPDDVGDDGVDESEFEVDPERRTGAGVDMLTKHFPGSQIVSEDE